MQENKTQNFFARVYEVVALVPRGKVISYGQIAALLGSPRSARQVGWALSTCPEELPWQRVVKADGSVTGGEYEELRRKLLAEEQVEFLTDGRVNMEAHRWSPSLATLKLASDLDEDIQAAIAQDIAEELDSL